MATAVELATGYVTVAVETSGVAKGVGRAFAGAEKMGASAGRNMGQSMSKAWAQTKPDMDQLAKDVERAESRATTAVQRNAAAQESAKRKVEIAQARANEATEKYGAKSSQALSASDRLATAQQKLEGATLKATTEQDKLNRELKDAKDAYAQAEKASKDAASASEQSASRYAAGWRGVGQKMRTYLVSGVKTAVGDADAAADDGGEDGAKKYAAGWKGMGQRLKSNLKTAVKNASDDAENEAESGGKRAGGGFADSFKGALSGIAAAVGIREIGQTLWSSVQESGNLEQSVGAIDSVFKGSAETMHGWAKSASTSVGMSANEFNELGTLIGAQLKNGGLAMDQLAPKTNELIGLGADLSSMFGGTTKEAVEALSSALKGERDPIEKYGVSLNQAKIDAKAAELGFEKVGGSLSAEANQAATLALVMEQTSDAHGNFARESDTFAHKQQVMQAKWLDLKAAMGEAFMPVLTNVFSFIGTAAIPALTNFAGHISAASETFGGIITGLRETADWWGPFAIGAGIAAIALGGWLIVSKGYLITAAATIAKNYALAASWVAANWPIMAVVAGIALVVGALILAYNKIGWFKAAVDFVFNGIKVVVGAVVSWWSTVAWPLLLQGFQIIGAAAMWLWNNAIVPAWNGIKLAIAVVAGWIVGTLVPWIRNAITVIGTVMSWLYQNIIIPVWNGIRTVIAIAVAIIMTIIQGWIWVIRNVLGPAFSWFYNSIIIPVWNGIKWFINAAWVFIRDYIFTPIRNFITGPLASGFRWFYHNLIIPVWNGIKGFISGTWNFIRDWIFNPIRNFITGPLAGTFRWFYDHVIKPVWDGIKGFVSATWNWVRDHVLDPMIGFVENQVVGAWIKAKDGIDTAWTAIKKIVDGPVDFVINTVINKGFIGNFNKIAEKFGIDKIGEISYKGLAGGGVVPGYQPRKIDDTFAPVKGGGIQPLRGGEGVLVPEVVRGMGSGFVHTANRIANTGGVSAVRRWVSQGLAKGGVASPFKGRSFPLTQGYNRIHKGIDIGSPSGTPIYATADGRVTHAGAGARAPGVWGGNEIHVKGGGLERWFAHLSEIAVRVGQAVKQGDYLGKTGNTGISSGPHLHFGVFQGGWPNDIDPTGYLAGSVAFGPDTGGGGGNGVFEELLGMINFDGLLKKIPGAGFATDLMKGAANTAWDGFQSYAMEALAFVDHAIAGAKTGSQALANDPVARAKTVIKWSSTVTDALKQAGLPTDNRYKQAWLRQIQTESGGDPNAVQGNIGDINNATGDLGKGLVQVIGSTFASYRDPSLPNNQFHPKANLVAGMNWAKHKYGVEGMLNVIGHGHGYARGGILPTQLFDNGGLIHEGITLVDHQRSDPDRVLTGQQWRDMHTLATQGTGDTDLGEILDALRALGDQQISLSVDGRDLHTTVKRLDTKWGSR